MACRLIGAKPLHEPVMTFWALKEQIFGEIWIKIQNFSEVMELRLKIII